MNDYKIKELYEEMEKELISSMKRNFKRHLKEEGKTGFQYTQWQAEKLKELSRYRKQNKLIIGDYTNGIHKEVSKHIQEEVKQGSIRAIKQYNRTVGTYANTTLPNGENALQCDIETYGGIEYSVRCKSQFLRSNEGLYFNTNKRNDNFTLWTETDNCRNGSCLSISNAIGPSWK